MTGAASGIGFATAKVFLREGANVALLDHNRDGLASAVAHLSGGSRQIASALADVTSEAELAMAVVDASSPLVRELRDLDKLVGVAAFREYQFEWPERICMDAVLDAERLGAVVRNYTPVKRLAREGDDWRITLGDAIDFRCRG